MIVSLWERAPRAHSTFVCHCVEMVFVRLGGESKEQGDRGYSRVVRIHVFAQGGHHHPGQQAVPQDECVTGQVHGRGESDVSLFLALYQLASMAVLAKVEISHPVFLSQSLRSKS